MTTPPAAERPADFAPHRLRVDPRATQEEHSNTNSGTIRVCTRCWRRDPPEGSECDPLLRARLEKATGRLVATRSDLRWRERCESVHLAGAKARIDGLPRTAPAMTQAEIDGGLDWAWEMGWDEERHPLTDLLIERLEEAERLGDPISWHRADGTPVTNADMQTMLRAQDPDALHYLDLVASAAARAVGLRSAKRPELAEELAQLRAALTAISEQSPDPGAVGYARVALGLEEPNAEEVQTILTRPGERAFVDARAQIESSSYADGHVAGDRARFVRCKQDVGRALGMPEDTEWAILLRRVREGVE